jgi:hypothetical protein
MEHDNALRYHQEAERLRREAETMISQSERDRLIEIARQYDMLADSIELTRHRGRPPFSD